MQAAIGLAQVERADELVDRKREIFRWYYEELAGTDGAALNSEMPGTKNSYWMVTVVLHPELGIKKEQLGSYLGERGIGTRPVFHPLSSIPAYREQPEAAAARSRNQQAYRVSPYGLNLPSAFSITRDQVAYVGQTIRELIAQANEENVERNSAA